MTEASILEYLTQPHVVMWAGIAAVSVGPCAAVAWWAVRTRESELRTIETLADRGYSADEIRGLMRRSPLDDFT